MSIPKFVSFKETICFRPAIIHFPSACDTVTRAAPHSSLGNACSFGCAKTEIENKKHSAARKTWFVVRRILRAHKISNLVRRFSMDCQPTSCSLFQTRNRRRNPAHLQPRNQQHGHNKQSNASYGDQNPLQSRMERSQ